MRIVRVVLVLCVPFAAGCVGISGESQDLESIAERQEEETVESLDVRLSEFALRFSSVTESAADEIMAGSGDPRVRREALLWKLEAIPACHLACFRPNPLGGLYDTWALCAQLRDYFVEGDGKDAFGEHQVIAVAACEAILETADSMGKSAFAEDGGVTVEGLFADGGDVDAKAAEIREVAKELPIGRGISSRISPVARFARYGQRERGALDSVASIELQLRRLERRLRIYVEHLPKQARWQAELLVMGILEEPAVTGVSTSLVEVNEHAGNVARSIAGLEGIIEKQVALVLETVPEERKTILENITTQRVEALNAVSQERIAALEAVHEERVATLKAVDESLERTVSDVFSRVDDRIDRALLWAVPAGAVAFVLLALLVWAAARRGVVRVELPGGAAPTREA